MVAATRGWTPCCRDRLEVRALSRPLMDSDTRLLPFSCLTEELVDVLRFRSRSRFALRSIIFPHQIHPPTVSKAMAMPPSKPPTIAPTGTLEEPEGFDVTVGPVSTNTVVVTTSSKFALVSSSSVEDAAIMPESDWVVGIGSN